MSATDQSKPEVPEISLWQLCIVQNESNMVNCNLGLGPAPVLSAFIDALNSRASRKIVACQGM